MLTAAVRDLYRAHGDRFVIGVDTSCRAIWEGNPYITRLDPAEAGCETFHCDYPLVQRSDQSPYHFIHGFVQDLEQKLDVRIPVTEFKGDIHLSDREKGWISQVEELGVRHDFWVMMAGGKYDFTAKWWDPAGYQRVVDHFAGRILFVQCGGSGHWHPPLRNVINLVGKTDLRQFIRLIHHSVGVICPVTFAMHAAAAVPVPPGRPPRRACVVIAGGREPAHWEAYPTHRFLANNGSLRCCQQGGCWKSRCQKVGDGVRKDKEDLCEQPVFLRHDLCIPRCMDMIRPADVIGAVETYYADGCLHYSRGWDDAVERSLTR